MPVGRLLPASARILGIDPGSLVTGFGVIERQRDGRLTCLAMGAIRAKGATFEERLVAIYDGLRKVIASHGPEEVAIEDIFYASNARSALKLGHARGVSLLAAAHAGLSVSAYSPMEVKKSIVGYGRAEKEQVRRMVCMLLGLRKPPEPLDASDALAVAICHAQNARFRQAVKRVKP